MENEKWDYMVKNSKKQPKRPIKYVLGILASCLCLVIFITSIYAASQQNLGTDVNIQYEKPNPLPAPTLEKLTFTYKDGYYVVSQKDRLVSGDIVIPDSYVSLPVTEIADYAFEDNTNITSVYIPNSIKTIGIMAFMGCTGLTEIDIPSSVETISGNAFCRSGLRKVNIPEGVKTIGGAAFATCVSLTEITVPSTVTSIGSVAFSSCSGLTKINYDSTSTLESNEGNTFEYAGTDGPGIEVSIGTHVTYVPNCFLQGSNIISLIIGDSVEVIGEAAFPGNANLTSVTIPASVTSIGDSAFDGCPMLCEVIINSPAIYEQLTDQSACGCLAINIGMMDLPHALTFKVLQDIDGGSNDFLNDNFSKSTEEIDGQMYNVYTDLSWE